MQIADLNGVAGYCQILTLELTVQQYANAPASHNTFSVEVKGHFMIKTNTS
jgi:hypothetical protein